MDNIQSAKLLRIFISEDDYHENRSVYETVVAAARAQNMAGVTVLKGVLGFGANKHMHTAKILRLSENLPLVIELVDEESKIQLFINQLDALLEEAVVTLEDIELMVYKEK